MTQGTIIIVIISSVFAMLLLGGSAIGATMIIRPKVLLRNRLKQIGVLSGGKQASEKHESRRQKRIQDKIKQLEQKGEKKGYLEGINDDLLKAGVETSPQTYLVISACAGVVSTFFYLMAGMPIVGAIFVLLIGIFGLPKFIIRTIASRRMKHFTASFADAIDLIVRGIRSGLPVGECFNIVAREFPPPLGEEFRLIVEGQRLGMTIEEILRRGLKRLPTNEYKFFAIVTQIQKQTGGNLADTLSNLSAVLRERKMMRDKIQAYSSEAKASAMIIGSLPFAVAGILSIVNPDYIMLLFTEPTGNILLAIGAFWMTCGTFVMKGMINFDI